MKVRFAKCWCVVVALLSLAGMVLAAESLVSLKFTPGGWDPAAWTLCKNPTVEHLGKWVQRDDCIENETPADKKIQALDQTLTTMIYHTKFSGNWTASATFEIGAGSAPGIIIAQDFAPDAQGRPQYGEFYEAIIYEKGLNLWRHFATAEGKRAYELAVYSTFALKPDTRYTLTVTRKGKRLEMNVDGHIVGLTVSALPAEVFLGVMGCEGVSRVYDFAVSR
jgi:hypothetical protein